MELFMFAGHFKLFNLKKTKQFYATFIDVVYTNVSKWIECIRGLK